MAIYFIIQPYLKIEGDLGGDLKEIAGEIKSNLREIVVVIRH
jgi:hypothetical protein